MNRHKAIWIAFPVLLVVWIALWKVTSSSSKSLSSSSTTAVLRPLTASGKTAPPQEKPSSSAAPLIAPEKIILRDPFQISDRAKEALREREEARLKKERETEEATRAALEATRAQPQETAAPVVLPALSLQGIMMGEEPKAIINRKIVKVGDVIEGAKVTQITKDNVMVQFQGQNFTLQKAVSEKRPLREGPAGPGVPPGGRTEGLGPARWGGRRG